SYLRFFCLAPSSSYIYTLSLHDALPISDPIFARLAADCGYSAVHLSGNAIHKSFCLPDQNLLTVTEIASRASQIADAADLPLIADRKSTRLNSSHQIISYAVFCLKKKNK